MPGWRQMAYEIHVADAVTRDRVWVSGRVDSGDSVLVPWGGPDLPSRKWCIWRVRVWDQRGIESEWSEPAHFEVGLLEASDWRARFVTPVARNDLKKPQPCPYLRRGFDLSGEVVRARLYITALGVYEVEINGTRVGDDVLAPGWSSYGHRLRYRTHEVTDLLRDGHNAIGVVIGDGWARGHLTPEMVRNTYTDRLAVIAQLEVTFSDGSETTVVSDDAWKSGTGPIQRSDLYGGEYHDARRDLRGWSRAGYGDATWPSVEVLEHDLSTLVAPTGPPVRRLEELEPVRMSQRRTGETVLDFGQNIVGRVRIHVAGPPGVKVVLRHAEMLEADGALATEPLRNAEAIDTYILSGADGGETWEPRFTYHGFRYVSVSGWPGKLASESITAVVLHSDMQRTGWFECSDERLNRLHENIRWSMRGNFVDVPTDCPQRDERLGWTGDLQVFAPTATLLFDVSGVLDDWLRDLAADQRDDGCVPAVVPMIDQPWTYSGAAGWSDVAVTLPALLAWRYGDKDLLERHFASMKGWVDWCRDEAGENRLRLDGFQFGDWLDPSTPPGRPLETATDKGLIATAWLARSAHLVALAADRLDMESEAVTYDELAGEVAEAFRAEFVTPNGRLVCESQTAYLLALAFDLLLPTQREPAGNRLVSLIEANGNRLGTGFLGTPLLLETLTSIGRDDVAYDVLLQTEAPSWLHQISQGATTVWERWEALSAEGAPIDDDMVSFNHFALGSVAEWMYGRLVGLRQEPDAPGWSHFVVEPHPGGGLTSAAARIDSPYGTIGASWKIVGRAFSLAVAVPPGTRAIVRLPGADPISVGPGRQSWERQIDIDDQPVDTAKEAS